MCITQTKLYFLISKLAFQYIRKAFMAYNMPYLLAESTNLSFMSLCPYIVKFLNLSPQPFDLNQSRSRETCIRMLDVQPLRFDNCVVSSPSYRRADFYFLLTKSSIGQELERTQNRIRVT